MKYPCLVPKRLCKTDIHVEIEGEGITEDGAPEILFEADLKCNYQDGGKRILTDEQKLIEVSGTALFPGDICPDVPNITSGSAMVLGIKRTIAQGRKARNPDGTVNFTELRLL
ncbi:hypothetical protein NE619_09800 [Anaerovorax odorimutans]|uniref:Uncharacterized protein n=1 Tax=Anaerovorax odorimutans TaxID=109327 RepID=A0ABT1RP98_9FIRM|nr:hypothetical protein [Anaerovorax odorimutans]MCQ4637024.1 hypothetical protein [Anaerovorax odorimutans]